VASVRGRGTTFRVYFPKLAEASYARDPHPATTASSHPEPSPTGIATILLVEDESGLRKFMSKVLEKQGYRVLETKDGEEALSICQDNLMHIDLVVTDYAMPRMTGLQLKEKVAAFNPSMKFLLISGYAEEVVEDNLQQGLNGGDFLEKPFLPDELARKVREMLSRTNGRHGEEDSHSANTCSEQVSDELDSGTSHG
jgi:two-component system, cell cycle sensor histidine kinase and response regulator CckA